MTPGARLHILCCFAVVVFTADAYAQSNSDVGASITRALEPLGRISPVANETQPHWQWTQVQVFDEAYPLTVDIVAPADSTPSKVIYFFPGGGTNFQASFFTPHTDNIAQYFREQGYVVVGITPREDNVPSDTKDTLLAIGWGLAKHRADVRHVIEAVQQALALPYEVLGHSYGAALALDYGANFSRELQRLIILDIYTFDPRSQADSILNAQRTYTAYAQLPALGVYLEAMGSDLAKLATWSDAELEQDSTFPRSSVSPYRGNFTNEGFYYYGLIETATIPGLHTYLSGLEFDWPLNKSYLAGTYTFADDPRADTYALTHVDREVLLQSSTAARSGLVPTAFSRDYWAAVAGNGSYRLDWSNIQCPFMWVNTELGYGEQYYGALVAREAGNANVQTHVVQGYGHADIFLGRNARAEVWPLFNQ